MQIPPYRRLKLSLFNFGLFWCTYYNFFIVPLDSYKGIEGNFEDEGGIYYYNYDHFYRCTHMLQLNQFITLGMFFVCNDYTSINLILHM